MISNIADEYVYKKEVDWSLLMEGLTLPVENQVIFGQIAGRFLQPGESKKITLYLNGKSYEAQIRNLNLDTRHNRKKGMMQIRYPRNGELSHELQGCFLRSYSYLKSMRESREKGDRTMLKLPEDKKEYLAIYTTEYDDSYILETIRADDIEILRNTVAGHSERILEAEFNFDVTDDTTGLNAKTQIVKIRKLNRKIGDNLKRLYSYRCQICGRMIGEEYGAHVAEAHHIDYFVKSLNNDACNQLIVCPNHHSIIHDVNPVFDRRRLLYTYENGMEEKLVLNRHL